MNAYGIVVGCFAEKCCAVTARWQMDERLSGKSAKRARERKGK